MKTQVHTLNEYPIPNTIDMEMQIIADIVSEQGLMHSAESFLNDDLFSNEDNLNAWRLLKQMYNGNKPIDLTTFSAEVNPEYTQRLMTKMVYASTSELQFMGHMESLRKTAVRRQMYIAAVSMLQSCVRPQTSIDELIDIPDKLIEGIRGNVTKSGDAQSIGQAINELGNRLSYEQQCKTNGISTRVATGFPTLDLITRGGFSSGDLVILAARPSVGKTATLLQMAKAAVMQGKAATIFSLEMTAQSLAQRVVLSSGEIPAKQLTEGMDWGTFERVVGEYEQLPMYINDSARYIDEICFKMNLAHHQGKADIVFIDYLGLINDGQGSRTPLPQRIGEITKRLKQTAKDCGVPIVLLCQLNRQSATDNRSPQLQDLRDSGSIEQDADIVLMLEKPTPTSLTMWVRKNRQGKAGVGIDLTINETYTQFTESGRRA